MGHSNTWPVSDNNQQLTFHSDGSLTTGAAEKGTDKFVNNPSQSEAAAVAKGYNPNRLLYVRWQPQGRRADQR